MYPGNRLGGADVDLLGILASHLGFGFRLMPEKCWASVDENFNFKDICSLGSVSCKSSPKCFTIFQTAESVRVGCQTQVGHWHR